MAKRKKSLKYSAEAAAVPATKRRCLLRVSIRDGVIESRLEELWARQGCVQVEDKETEREVS